MTTGIYLLVFEGVDSVYVGQSKNIEKRYKEHVYSLKIGTSSKKLQVAYTLYGIPSYNILLVCSASELDEEEVSYIKEFDSVDNGFNTIVYPNSGLSYPGEDHPASLYSNEEYLSIMKYIIDNNGKSNDTIAKELGCNISVVGGISAGTRRTSILQELYPIEFNKLTEIRLHRDSLKIVPKADVIQNREAYIKIANL